ncbi:MAG: 3-hydroxybutyryl-CoA dehydrogenase [Acidimicrobiia bacterium]|nr:3-hydroxybutyryl-CoA dehydrogenase [Acidimicrobiia bacterium]
MRLSYQRIGVVGGGQMGAGIAEVAARAGCDVAVREISVDAAEAARTRIEKSLDRAVQKEKLDDAQAKETISRLSYTTDLEELSDRELVIEAVIEDEGLKKEIFQGLDSVLSGDSVIVSNTSSIPITRLAAVTERPDRVLGLHFFNPVPVMALVELVTTVISDEEIETKVQEFAEGLGKTVIRAKDRGGFIVNMLLVPYMLGAIRMYESGFASAEDIDAGMRLGANHPMGPLELSDFVGLDTMKLVADVLFDEFKEAHYASPPLLTRMVEAGWLGRKSGRGFYTYE